jgi:2EXR family
VFPRLPIELKDEIWKHFSKHQPRTVSIAWDRHHAPVSSGNKVPTLYQISQDTRTETLKQYGYFLLTHPVTHESLLFHPELDMLYITESKPFMYGPTALMENLKTCGALERIKSIACSLAVDYFNEYLEEFGKCTSLELLLPVWDTADLATYHSTRSRLLGFRLEDAEVTLAEDFQSAIDHLKTRSQRLMARAGGVTSFLREVNHIEIREEL